MTIYKPGDVVVAPFPFTDTSQSKPRPVLVISNPAFNESHEKIIGLMITTATGAKWPSDTPIANLEACGLAYPSCVRMKCFTLDTSLVKKRIGAMAKRDWSHAQKKLHTTIAI